MKKATVEYHETMLMFKDLSGEIFAYPKDDIASINTDSDYPCTVINIKGIGVMHTNERINSILDRI